MTLRDLPIVRTVADAGAEDPVFDGLLLVGPICIGVVAVFDRSLVTELLAVSYVFIFLLSVCYRAISRRSQP